MPTVFFIHFYLFFSECFRRRYRKSRNLFWWRWRFLKSWGRFRLWTNAGWPSKPYSKAHVWPKGPWVGIGQIQCCSRSTAKLKTEICLIAQEIQSYRSWGTWSGTSQFGPKNLRYIKYTLILLKRGIVDTFPGIFFPKPSLKALKALYKITYRRNSHLSRKLN